MYIIVIVVKEKFCQWNQYIVLKYTKVMIRNTYLIKFAVIVTADFSISLKMLKNGGKLIGVNRRNLNEDGHYVTLE